MLTATLASTFHLPIGVVNEEIGSVEEAIRFKARAWARTQVIVLWPAVDDR